MKSKRALLVLFFILLLAGCSAKEEPQSPGSCLERMPQKITGLVVKGERSETNVISNVWPMLCKAEEFYLERRKTNPKRSGIIELELRVEFNGEIGEFSILRNTVDDPDLEKDVIGLFEFFDFDPFGKHNSESEIILPIRFSP